MHGGGISMNFYSAKQIIFDYLNVLTLQSAVKLPDKHKSLPDRQERRSVPSVLSV